eukprot:m.11466 g.11466  ORF g.11466 m.11466 type:complete len:650 (+) comp4453_c0_seq1:162-2111(+)
MTYIYLSGWKLIFPQVLVLVACIGMSLGASCTTQGELDCERSVVLDAQYYNMTWSMAVDKITIKIQVSSTTKWAGFGIGEPGAGSMPGADVVLVYKSEGIWIAEDAYTYGFTTPVKDLEQDWTLLGVAEGVNGIEFELQRALNTTHNGQDRVIPVAQQDLLVPSDFIFARGETDTPTYHGVFRWRKRMHLYKNTDDTIEFQSLPDYDSTVVVANKNVLIPTYETTYYEAIFDDATWFNENLNGRTLIGISGFASEGSALYVHHMVVYALGVNDFDEGGEQFYTWTPGVAALVLPSNVGFNLNGYRGIRIQFHFDNKAGVKGVQDNSGIKLYLTAKNSPREHAFGLLQLGDPGVGLEGIEIYPGLSMYQFSCPSLEANQDITILGHLLHMHSAGVMMQTFQYRGEELIDTAQIEYYDYATQGTLFTNTTAKKGDRFVTQCFYQTGSGTKMGLASSEEMCMDFVGYYPKQDKLAYCGFERNGEYNGGANVEELPRAFGENDGKAPTVDPELIKEDGDGKSLFSIIKAKFYNEKDCQGDMEEYEVEISTPCDKYLASNDAKGSCISGTSFGDGTGNTCCLLSEGAATFAFRNTGLLNAQSGILTCTGVGSPANEDPKDGDATTTTTTDSSGQSNLQASAFVSCFICLLATLF